VSDAVLEDYLGHLAAGDHRRALDLVVSLVRSGTPLDTVVEDVVRAAQVEVGRRWERNEWTVAQEHVATAVSESVLAALGDTDEPSAGGSRGRLVAVCAEGEWHTLALRVLTDHIRRAGWGVVYLGPSVPASQLGRYLYDVGPDGLLVSCSVPFNLGGARRLIEAARATGTPVLAGGRGFGADGRRARILGADAWAPSPAAAVERLESWTSFTTPAAPLTHPGFVEHVRLEQETDDVLRRALAALADAYPPVKGYTGDRLDRTVEDLHFLLRFVSAALLVDEPALLAEYLAWLEVVLGTRGLPPSVVGTTVDAVARAIDGELPRATDLLRAT
jgi:methanogenic corrinoid protein MtbC1